MRLELRAACAHLPKRWSAVRRPLPKVCKDRVPWRSPSRCSALGRLLADKGQWNAMIAEIIAVRRQEIDSHLLLGIRVKRRGIFPTTMRGPISAGACGRTALVFDPDLASGDLLFDLRLGEMEVGPATQGATCSLPRSAACGVMNGHERGARQSDRGAGLRRISRPCNPYLGDADRGERAALTPRRLL